MLAHVSQAIAPKLDMG